MQKNLNETELWERLNALNINFREIKEHKHKNKNKKSLIM